MRIAWEEQPHANGERERERERERKENGEKRRKRRFLLLPDSPRRSRTLFRGAEATAVPRHADTAASSCRFVGGHREAAGNFQTFAPKLPQSEDDPRIATFPEFGLLPLLREERRSAHLDAKTCAFQWVTGGRGGRGRAARVRIKESLAFRTNDRARTAM